VEDQDWETLLWAIEEERCTPFLGAGACAPPLPLGAQLAREWAEEHGYPLKDDDDLARVAEYVAIHRKVPMFPKHAVRKKFGAIEPPDFAEVDEPHGVLADLPIPVYLTTNYVDFMAEALRKRNRNPRIDFCRWNDAPAVRRYPSALPKAFTPSAKEPVVYHLHGHLDVPQSLVLTESDYVSFLVAISRPRGLMPHQIERAFANASLVFIGYSFADWDFKVIYRGLVTARDSSLRELGISVQLRPDDERAKEYFDSYFNEMDLRVYWGTAREFAAELGQRWKERHNPH
jgi:hypothetical protein